MAFLYQHEGDEEMGGRAQSAQSADEKKETKNPKLIHLT